MRVLLADDDADVRSALRLFLESVPGLRVVAEATKADDVVAQARAARPDVVLLDWDLPTLAGGQGLTAIRACDPGCTVVAMSSRREAQQGALALGAAAFICKVDPPEDLLAALNQALSQPPTGLPDDEEPA
jgi:DNA-binding NarL/FixJ family response regulator